MRYVASGEIPELLPCPFHLCVELCDVGWLHQAPWIAVPGPVTRLVDELFERDLELTQLPELSLGLGDLRLELRHVPAFGTG